MSEPVQVEFTEVDKTPASLWGYSAGMGKRYEEEITSVTLGGDEELPVWAEVNFAGGGLEKIFDKNLQLLTRYADAGPNKMPWAKDKSDTWGSSSFVGSKAGAKDVINETKKGDTFDRISIRPHEFLDLNFQPIYVIQGTGSPDGERKIYIVEKVRIKR